MPAFQCLVVTPESTALDAMAEFVALPLYDGEIGIGAGHSPMIGRLGYGEMRLKTPDGEKKYYVDGGFVQVAGNVVTVLTNKAMPSSAIKVDEAEKSLADAVKKPAATEELAAIRDRQITQARAQIRASKRAR